MATPVRPGSSFDRDGSLATPSANLSVIVLTYNEESNLPSCLASLRDLRCEVFVVDSGSTDRTVEIALSFGATVHHHPFENYAIQRNWAQSHLPLSTDWILHLDADERLTPELVAELNALLANPPRGTSGYLLRKRTVFMGKWIRHGGHYPSYHARLFRRSSGRCEDRLYDQHFVVDGHLGKLKGDYIDVVSSSIQSWTLRHTRWAGMEALEMVSEADGRHQIKPERGGNPIQRKRWWRNTYGTWPLFFRAWCYWFYRYFVRLGFLDGKEGMIFHFLQGFWFRFLVDAIIWERQGLERAGKR